MGQRRNLKALRPTVLDILKEVKMEMTTSELKEVLYDAYGVELSAKDVWYILEEAANDGANITKIDRGTRLAYQYMV